MLAAFTILAYQKLIRSKQRKHADVETHPRRRTLFEPQKVCFGGFQDWIVPLPGVHGSSLCILNFTAKKDKKELKWTVFGKNARKLCEKGKNP